MEETRGHVPTREEMKVWLYLALIEGGISNTEYNHGLTGTELLPSYQQAQLRDTIGNGIRRG